MNGEHLKKEFAEHLYEEIFVVQRIDYHSRDPIEEDRLSERYLLEQLLAHQTSDEYFLQISRVKSIRAEKEP